MATLSDRLLQELVDSYPIDDNIPDIKIWITATSKNWLTNSGHYLYLQRNDIVGLYNYIDNTHVVSRAVISNFGPIGGPGVLWENRDLLTPFSLSDIVKAIFQLNI